MISTSVVKVTDEQKRLINDSYRSAKKRFLRWLARERAKDLTSAGFKTWQIARMRKGNHPQASQRQWVIHHRIPRSVSGAMQDPNQFDNLCLMRRTSHRLLHDYIDPQVSRLVPGMKESVNLPCPREPLSCARPAQVKAWLDSLTKPRNNQTRPNLAFPGFQRFWKAYLSGYQSHLIGHKTVRSVEQISGL